MIVIESKVLDGEQIVVTSESYNSVKSKFPTLVVYTESEIHVLNQFKGNHEAIHKIHNVKKIFQNPPDGGRIIEVYDPDTKQRKKLQWRAQVLPGDTVSSEPTKFDPYWTEQMKLIEDAKKEAYETRIAREAVKSLQKGVSEQLP